MTRHLLLAVSLLAGCGGDVADAALADAGSDDGATTDTSTVGDSASSVDASPVSDAAADASRFDACDGPAQCLLAITDCCGKCGEPAITDFDAIHRDHASARRAAVCKEPSPACPDCITLPNPNLVAFCRDERCVGVDLRADSIAECAKDDDCTLRAGSDCCESCGVPEPSRLIALAKTKAGELPAQVCDPLAGACPPCVPSYPATVKAACDPSTKRCRVVAK